VTQSNKPADCFLFRLRHLRGDLLCTFVSS